MSGPIRLLVTGSREFSDTRLVERWLRWVARKAGERGVRLIGGDAKGLDAIAFSFAFASGWELREYKALDYGVWPYCGPLRNQAMVEREQPHICLAFLIRNLKQKGTPDCASRAMRAGVYTRLIYQRRDH